MRTCPFRGCDESLPDSVFACRRHWFQLDRAERNKIWTAYRRYLADVITMEELREAQQQVLGHRGTA